MRQSTDTIASKLAILNDKASNITTVITTINKVADQTNLLSLNAAIEAEKAGEYGKGFAVVATEIRRLADQTAVATWDIEQMIKEMQSAVSAGVMGMDKFSDDVTRGVDEIGTISRQLGDIIHEVQALTPRFETVTEGMQSQALGGEQISESMIQLNETAQHTADSLRQSNQSIQQLKDAANGLQTAVSIFKVRRDD
jgi:methyl-accepting chemotaxis protein WspA